MSERDWAIEEIEIDPRILENLRREQMRRFVTTFVVFVVAILIAVTIATRAGSISMACARSQTVEVGQDPVVNPETCVPAGMET